MDYQRSYIAWLKSQSSAERDIASFRESPKQNYWIVYERYFSFDNSLKLKSHVKTVGACRKMLNAVQMVLANPDRFIREVNP